MMMCTDKSFMINAAVFQIKNNCYFWDNRDSFNNINVIVIIFLSTLVFIINVFAVRS